MHFITRITLALSILLTATCVTAAPASAAFTSQGSWNVPEFQETWDVTGSATEFRYVNVMSAGTDWESSYSVIATLKTATPLVFVGDVVASGTVNNPSGGFTGTIEIVVGMDGRSFVGTIKYGNGWPNDVLNATCASGPCLKNTPVWPALPSPLVTLESVANGCGPGTAGNKPRFFDTSKYKDKKTKVTYEVTFRKACDVHDAAYNGARIKDPFNDDKMVDFYNKSRYDIDERFYDDMRTLCFQQIPGHAINARYQCTQNGGTFSTGARTRYRAVKAVGHRSFVKRPKLQGTWIARDARGKAKPAWPIRQSNRILIASWKKPNNTGSFRGIIISKDGKSMISGFVISKVNGANKNGRVTFVWNPETPNRMRLTGVLGGLVLTR